MMIIMTKLCFLDFGTLEFYIRCSLIYQKCTSNSSYGLPHAVLNNQIILFRIGEVILPICFFLARLHLEYLNDF